MVPLPCLIIRGYLDTWNYMWVYMWVYISMELGESSVEHGG